MAPNFLLPITWERQLCGPGCPKRAGVSGSELTNGHFGPYEALFSWCKICRQAVAGAGRQRDLSEVPTCALLGTNTKKPRPCSSLGLGGVSSIICGTGAGGTNASRWHGTVNVAEALKVERKEGSGCGLPAAEESLEILVTPHLNNLA